jgi:hypothetical protein
MNGAINQRQWAPLSKKLVVIQGFDAAHRCNLEGCPAPCPHMLATEAQPVLRAFLLVK